MIKAKTKRHRVIARILGILFIEKADEWSVEDQGILLEEIRRFLAGETRQCNA